jgi:phosphoglycolate phosphatase-like HAD superfamily hydrolase
MLTYEEAKRLFDYDPETGVIRWKIRVSRNVGDGREAGNTRTNHSGKKYKELKIYGKKYQSHRVIHLLQTGEWPPDQIDHIDGNGLNNRWENLRGVTPTENNRNVRRQCNNTSGQTGVHWDTRYRKWRARIWTNKRAVCLGRFTTLEEAIAARKKAEIEHNFHPNHGTDRPL